MKAVLAIKKLTKAEVLDTCLMSYECKRGKDGVVYLWYYQKSYMQEDLKELKKKYGRELDYAILSPSDEKFIYLHK